MDIPASDSGSRVTRSLRKRLTSTDDSSSRPGTPMSTKLSSITEISASPSKSTRSTRRNSVSGVATPVKTPAKLAICSSVIPEDSESHLPVRNTRRRSILVKENDEIHQTSLKNSTNIIDDKILQSNENKKPITRSKSRSPRQENLTKSHSPKETKISCDENHKGNEINAKNITMKKRKPGPKSKTCEYEILDMSDIEITVFGDEIADIKNESSSKKLVVLTDDSNQMSSIQRKDYEEHKIYNLKSQSANTVVNQINANMMSAKGNDQDSELNSNRSKDEKNLEFILENSSQDLIDEASNFSQFEKIEHEENKTQSGEQDMSEIKKGFEKEIFGDLPESEVLDINRGSNTFVSNCTISDNNSLAYESKIMSTNVETSSYDCKEVQKKVDFVASPSNHTPIKTVYPKTPASTKATIASKNLRPSLENDSFLPKGGLENQNLKVENNKFSKNGLAAGFQNGMQISETSVEQDLKIVESNNGKFIAEKTLSKLESHSHQEIYQSNAITKESENFSSHSQNQDEELKWFNPSVTGNTEEGSKLDVISTDDFENNIKDAIAENITDKKKIMFSSNDEVEDQNEDNYYEEEYKRKHDYIDDEAIEVEHYESGDSMDSNERREIDLNEVPVDAESIGSQSTYSDQDECGEEEESFNSFIVSDNEGMEKSESDNKNEQIGGDCQVKKLYRRIQGRLDSSSSDEVEEQKLENFHKSKSDIDFHNSIEATTNIQNEEISNSILEKNKDFEKLINLKYQTKSSDSFSERNSSNKSYNSINLDSSKLSESALRLHYASYNKSEEEDIGKATNISHKKIISDYVNLQRLNKSVRDLIFDVDDPPGEYNDSCKVVVAENISKEEHKNSSFEEDVQIEYQLGEVTVASGGDTVKEMTNKSLNASLDQKNGSSLSVPVSEISKENIECQMSLTVGVTLKDGKIEELTDVNAKNCELDDLPPVYEEIVELENKNIENFEDIRNIPLQLGNPLIRTRRQSLALPTNPDMEICSYVGKSQTKLGVLPNIDFEPSQSFIENLELRKNEKNMLSAKRKRLSKSFGGSTEAHDHSIIDINTRHLHKKSKLMDENSVEESDQGSVEVINSSKIFSQISSTPREKIKMNDSYNKRILTRCDEILEAANLAKLEAKIKKKKNKTKTNKKWKRKSVYSISESLTDKTDVPRKIKRKDKTKAAISQAFMAADTILNKPKISTLNKVGSMQRKIEEPEVIENIGKTSTKKKCEKEINQQNERIETVCPTSAGNFMEFPRTPEKKKKPKYIQLRTGKIIVEPVTPKKIRAVNSSSFRESPLTPCVNNSRVKKFNSLEDNTFSSTILRTSKRNPSYNESLKNIKPNASWTQSGFFKEEVLLNRNVASKKTKQKQERNQSNVRDNFKESALARPYIHRSTKREVVMLDERKRAFGTITNNKK